MHSNDTYKLTVMIHKDQETFLISVMNCRNSVTYVQRQMNILLRQLKHFAKIYIDDIIVRFRSLAKHIDYLRQLFILFVRKNIELNLIKIFLDYSKVILLEQRVNVFDLSTTKERLKTLTSLHISDTLTKFETYFELTDYIRQYIHFYAIKSRSLQNLKTALLKAKSANNSNVKRKVYIFKMKLMLTYTKEKSFKTLQRAIAKATMLVHFDFERIL